MQNDDKPFSSVAARNELAILLRGVLRQETPEILRASLLEFLPDMVKMAVKEELLHHSEEARNGEMISPAEATRLFHPAITVQTLINWAKAGRLKKFTTPGGRVFYKRADVLAICHENKRYSHAP